MTDEELKKKCTERARIFQQAMESCKSSNPIDCIEWFADRIAELEKENTELKEFYEKEYFEIADRTADEKIKELEKYQTEVTVDDYSPYDENTWGMMHEEMFVPKELVRVLLKESYALSEHRNDQLTKAKELLERLLITSCNSDVLNLLPNCSEVLRVRVEAEQFLNSEVGK